MSETTCIHCTAKVTNGLALCARCQTTLSVSLVNVAAYHADVLRIRPGERVKVRSAYQSTPPPSTAPPFDPISAHVAVVDNMLATWCRVLVDDRPQVGHAPKGATKQAGWLEGHGKTIATLPWAAELLRDCLDAERSLQRILDRADTGWYAGKCSAELAPERAHDGFTCGCACHHAEACDVPGGCGEETTIPAVVCGRGLYGTPGHGWIRCPECGTTHDAGARREHMIAEAREQVAPVAVIARAVVGLLDTEQSVQRLTNRIDKWVSRKQLRDLGVRVVEGRPRRVYRIGDVFDLLSGERATPSGEADAVEPAC